MEYNAYGNQGRAADVRAAVEARGDTFTIWMTRDFTAAEARGAVLATGASGFVAEGEIPAYAQGQPNPQAQDWQELADALADLPIQKAVATSYSPFQGPTHGPEAELAKPLIDDGWHLIPYVYPAENAGDNIASKAQYAQHFTHEARPDLLDPGEGWYNVEPVLGCYSGAHGSFTVDDFPLREECIGWSVWAAEYVL